jgi:hypothetical protein
MPADVRPFRWTAEQRNELKVQLPIQLAACDVTASLHGGLVRYIVDGILPGGFLQACLCNSLPEAARRGDARSLMSLPGIIAFLEHVAPRDCWGSREKVLAWTSTPDRLEICEP